MRPHSFPHMRSLRHYNGRLIKTKKVMLCFPTRLVLGAHLLRQWFLVAHNAHGFLGDVVAEYRFPASSFVMSPTQPLMYATIPSQNSVAIINTNTLAVEDTVFVGSHPVNLAFSPNGLKAYIANSASNFVVVLDTHSRTDRKFISPPTAPAGCRFWQPKPVMGTWRGSDIPNRCDHGRIDRTKYWRL